MNARKLLQPRYSPLEAGITLFVALLIVEIGTLWMAKPARINAVQTTVATSPLPAVKLAETAKANDPNAYRHPYTFTSDWFTTRLPSWRVALAPYVGRNGLSYLEIGVFEGRSLFWMLDQVLTATDARATVIDLFDGPYAATYRNNLEVSGSAGKVTTLTGYSQVLLRGLPLDSFDVIYIDGSHKPFDVLEDAVLCWRLLRVGGLVIFDDYANLGIGHDYQGDIQLTGELWHPAKAIDPFVQCLGDQCQVIHNDFQLIIKKVK
jgi:hypothetical protein